jgi:hypothetical protein
MESLKPPRTLRFYQLIKFSTKSGMSLNLTGMQSPNGYLGAGIYRTQEKAEHNRTLEILKDSEDATFHVFELEFPNPAYREQ